MTTAAGVFDFLEELRQVRALLITPTGPALADCQRKLARVIDAMRASRQDMAHAPETGNLVQDIHRLLESAKRFWDLRQTPKRLEQNYAPRGLAQSAWRSTFAIEV